MFSLNKILPEYPRTPALPYSKGFTVGDLVASEAECASIFNNPNVIVQEKIDGANVGMMFYENHPVIRNRTSILSKGHSKAKTPAKVQFNTIFNWFYDHQDKFERLNTKYSGIFGVYGEWCVALHGVVYNKLPSYFVAYDVFDVTLGKFVEPNFAEEMLVESGFSYIKNVTKGPLDLEKLVECLDLPSEYSSTEKLEGVYIKEYNANTVTKRFKLLRPDYVQGSKWSEDKIIKQKLNSK